MSPPAPVVAVYHAGNDASTLAIETIALFDLVMGAVAAIGLLYLLYVGSFVVHYRRFFKLILIGLLVYAVTGPIVGTLAPAFIHAIHGLAALFVAVGLWDLVRGDLEAERDLAAVWRSATDEPG